MKVRDMIEMDIDIDVYDDVCEELAICFCGPVKLTAEGEEHFAEVLDYNVETVQDDDIVGHAIILIDGDDGDYWKRRLCKAKEFFSAAAGYCSEENYNSWFCSVEE